jgi:hypothetical protein
MDVCKYKKMKEYLWFIFIIIINLITVTLNFKFILMYIWFQLLTIMQNSILPMYKE